MFSRKPKEVPPPQQRRAKTGQMTAQLPGMDLPGVDFQGQMEAMVYGPDDDGENADLEQELLSLMDGGSARPSPERPAPRPSAGNKPKNVALQRMPRTGDDDDDEDDDEEDDGIDPENDPELLAELNGIVDDTPSPNHLPAPGPPQQDRSPSPMAPSPSGGSSVADVIKQRLENYRLATENAKKAGESSKARRCERGAKTLEGLLKQAKMGKPIAEDDIPPEISVGEAKPNVAPSDSMPNNLHDYNHVIDNDVHPVPQPMTPPVHVAPRPPPMQPQPLAQRVEIMPPVPPPRNVERQAPTVQQPAPSEPPSGSFNGFVHQELTERRAAYKAAALTAKHNGDLLRAKQLYKFMKEFDNVITALQEGNEIDLTHMPPPPEELPHPSTEEAPGGAVGGAASEQPSPVEVEPPTQKELSAIFGAPEEAPTTVLEALEQRLAKYKVSSDQAKAEGNGGKVRRMGRICKQYEDAIKATKAKRPFEYEELPVPPGFPPLPTGQSLAPAAPARGPSPQPSPRAPHPKQSPQVPSLPNLAAAAARNDGTPSPPGQPTTQPEKEQTPSGILPNARGPIKRQGTVTQVSRLEQQVVFLKKRYAQFKQAALDAKNSGDIDKAKELIRSMKGIEPMIEASQNGYPVDISQVPVPPQHSKDEDLEFEIVQLKDVEDDVSSKIGEESSTMSAEEREAVFHRLEEAVIHQIQVCTRNTQHFQAIGDIRKVTEFEQLLALNRKDLDALRNAFKHSEAPPKFHYESKTFSLVQCAPDLGDTDLELTVVRGVDFKPPQGFEPKDVDTYIKFEFPYPQEEPQKNHTHTIKSTVSPQFDQSFKLEINRKRTGQRVFSNKSVKFEIFYKAGFLKGDKLLGTASIKLETLMTKFEIHDSVDLYDGRRPCGGRLEVRLRVREPITGKHVETVTEKWLIIDQFFGNPKKPVEPLGGPGGLPVITPDIFSIEIVKYEVKLIEEQIQNLRGKLTEQQEQALIEKRRQLQRKIEKRQMLLKQGGVSAYKTYLSQVAGLLPELHNEARQMAAAGNREKAKIILTKKKVAEQEVALLKSKLVGR